MWKMHFVGTPVPGCPGRTEKEGPGQKFHVIARPKAVAISWNAVQIRPHYQEIAPQAFPSVTTSGFALLAMTEVISTWPF